ncbi:hypothetical protein TrVFT333_001644 [Trichoderma virens FT-333]|nr:hypothetical protein TrVFT333_001644 [Trichoderma virens FT-333]
MAQNFFLYLVKPHCVLCRNDLPRRRGLRIPRGSSMEWEKDVAGFFDVALNQSQDPVVYTLNTTLDEDGPVLDPTFDLEHQGVKMTVTVARDNPNPSAKHRPLFFAHQLCCKLVEKLQGSVSFRDLYYIAMQTHKILAPDFWGEEHPTSLASFEELQGYVLTYLFADGNMNRDGNNIVSSLMTAIQTLTIGCLPASSDVHNHPSFRKLLPADHVEVAHVSASVATLFGRPYMRAIEVFHSQDHHDVPGQQCVELKIDSVCQIEFVVGMYGITAIRFHLNGNSVSPWLGDAGRGWRCKPIDVTRNDLSFPKKGQQGVVQRFAQLLARTPADAPLTAFWDASMKPFHDGVCFLTHYFTEIHEVRLSPFPGRPMCVYLPLQLNGRPVTGITVYASDLGTTCIAVHEKGAHYRVSAPDRRGVSWTFHFKEGEEIETLGLVTTGQSGHRCGPFMLFKTNLDRIAYFGPQTALQDTSAQWVSLIPDHLKEKCAVVGLVVDKAAISLDGIKTIGVRCMPKEGVATNKAPVSSSGLHLTLPTPPRCVKRRRFKHEGVVTRAHLYDIKQIRLLTKPARDFDNLPILRYCGLWILHGDGSVDTIGCWDGALTKSAKVIYDETQGRLTRIIFRVKDGRYPENPTDLVPFIFNITIRITPHDSSEQDREEEPSHYDEIGNYITYCKTGWKKYVVWTYTPNSDNVQHASPDTKNFSIPPHNECNLVQIEN